MVKPHSSDFSIDEIISSDKGVIFSPPKISTRVNIRLEEDQTPFHWNGYKKGSAPERLGHVNLTGLKRTYARCLDMPLRLAGEPTYSLPEEWLKFLPILQQLTGVEHQHNPNWLEYNTYLTVDSKKVKVEEQQRHGGLHVDGFQGERINPKNKITRNYVMTTNGGTRFYPQSFIVVDETKFNIFQGFDLQAKSFIVAEENVAYFMDAYTVHESGIAVKAGLRTFLRLTYDVKKFDRVGNTHNSMLDYSWDMVDRKVHEMVLTPTLLDVENSPHK